MDNTPTDFESDYYKSTHKCLAEQNQFVQLFTRVTDVFHVTEQLTIKNSASTILLYCSFEDNLAVLMADYIRFYYL